MPADVFVDTNVLVYPGAESLSGLITLQQPPTLTRVRQFGAVGVIFRTLLA